MEWWEISLTEALGPLGFCGIHCTNVLCTVKITSSGLNHLAVNRFNENALEINLLGLDCRETKGGLWQLFFVIFVFIVFFCVFWINLTLQKGNISEQHHFVRDIVFETTCHLGGYLLTSLLKVQLFSTYLCILMGQSFQLNIINQTLKILFKTGFKMSN